MTVSYFTAIIGFIKDDVKYRCKVLPVNMCIRFDQRIFQFGKFFKEKVFIKKTFTCQS